MAKKVNIDFKKLPKWARVIIAVVPTVVALVLVILLGIMPKTEQIDRLKNEIAEQEKKIAKAQSTAGRLEDLIAENKRLKDLLEKLESQLPEEHEISSLLKQVSDLGVEAGLEILAWSPAAKRKHPSGIVYEVPVSVRLTGSYHRLGRFFSSLTGLERIVNITNISLGGPNPKKDEAILSVGFSAVTFTAVAEGGLSGS